MAVISIEEIVDEYGNYYIDQGQNMQNLYQKIYYEFGTRDAYTFIPTENTIWRDADTELSEITQPGNSSGQFTPKGNLTINPDPIPLFPIKIDLLFTNLKALQATWVGFLVKSGISDPLSYPFTKWLIEQKIIPQIQEEMELQMIFGGVRVEPVTPGVPGTAANSMNGMQAWIRAKNAVTTKIDPIAIGAWSNDPVTFVSQIEEFRNALPPKYLMKEMPLNISPSLFLRYLDGYRLKYNYQAAMDPKAMYLPVLGTAMTLTARASLIGSDAVWATPKTNAKLLGLNFGATQMFQLEKEKRNLVIYTDWWMGAGTTLDEAVFINDTGW